MKLVVQDCILFYTTEEIRSVYDPFMKDINGDYVKDGYGSYVFTLGGALEIVKHTKYDFKYGAEVELDELNSKIADIEENLKAVN